MDTEGGTKQVAASTGRLSPQQIGKCGELLVQYKLLLSGIESARLTTDAGVDLVAYSPRREKPVTIQVKTNLEPKPSGGRGKPTLDWWIPETTPAELVAVVDLSKQRVWVFKSEEMPGAAQQHTEKGMYHLYMYCDPTVSTGKKQEVFTHQFTGRLLENRLHELF